MKNPIKYFIIGFIFCFCNFISFGQTSKTDSLLSVLKLAKEDTNKVKVFNALAYELRNSSTQDTCIELSKQALLLSEKLKWNIGIGESYGNLQWFYLLKSDYAASLDYAFKALDLWVELSKNK